MGTGYQPEKFLGYRWVLGPAKFSTTPDQDSKPQVDIIFTHGQEQIKKFFARTSKLYSFDFFLQKGKMSPWEVNVIPVVIPVEKL